MAAPEPGAGDVPITLDGEEFTLKPSLAACIGISSIAGGLSQAVARCHQLNFDTVCEVICHGLNATSAANKKEVQEKVYKTGLIAVSADAILFIRTIANGGQRPDDEGEGDEQGDRPLAGASPLETTTSSS